MKTQISKPARTKASYSEAYKQQALELWRNSGRSAAKVAAELGIRPPLLYRWARAQRGPTDTNSAVKPARDVHQLEAEIERLQEEAGKGSCFTFYLFSERLNPKGKRADEVRPQKLISTIWRNLTYCDGSQSPKGAVFRLPHLIGRHA